MQGVKDDIFFKQMLSSVNSSELSMEETCNEFQN